MGIEIKNFIVLIKKEISFQNIIRMNLLNRIKLKTASRINLDPKH